MKTIINIILGIILAVSAGLAQDISTNADLQAMPAWSPDVARLQAKAWVRAGRITISSTTMVGGSVELCVVGENFDDVLNKLSASLQFQVVNREDWVFANVALWGDLGEDVTLFFGSRSARARDWVPHEHIDLTVASIPVLAGVDRAELLVLSEDGSTWDRWNVRVQGGHAVIDSWLMSRPNATLIAYFEDGSIKTYSLGEPSAGRGPLGSNGQSGVVLADHYTYTNPTEVNLVVTERPSLEIHTSSQDGCSTLFDVVGVNPDGGLERPTAMVQVYYTEDGTLRVAGVFKPWADGRFTLGMSGPHTFYFFFLWDQFGAKEPLYTGGGGVGVGVAKRAEAL